MESPAAASVTPKSLVALFGATETTSRIYEDALAAWWEWCERRRRTPWPANPADLAEYVRHLRPRYSEVVVRQHVGTVIGRAHQHVGWPNPAQSDEVRQELATLRRNAVRTRDPRLPDEGPAGVRLASNRRLVHDRALLETMWGARLTCAEAADLRWIDIQGRPNDGDGSVFVRSAQETLALSEIAVAWLGELRNMTRHVRGKMAVTGDAAVFSSRRGEPASAAGISRLLASLTAPEYEEPPPIFRQGRNEFRRALARRHLQRLVLHGWTEEDLARALGRGEGLIQRWLAGNSTPPAYLGYVLFALTAGHKAQAPRETDPPAVMKAAELHRWMERRRWRATTLARVLGVSLGTAHKWQRGDVRIPPELALAISDIDRRIERLRRAKQLLTTGAESHRASEATAAP